MSGAFDDMGDRFAPLSSYGEEEAQPWVDHEPERKKGASKTFNASGAGWVIQTAAQFTADFVSPEYIIDGTAQRGQFYLLTAPTGSGKTAVMLYLAAVIADRQTFAGREIEAGDVLFLAGENPDDVRARFIATMEYNDIDPRSCRVHFIPKTFSIRADMERLREAAAKLPNLVLVIVDTFAAYYDGEDENSNAQALDFAQVVRQITEFPSRPAVIMPAHPVKGATKANLSPKGGSSLLNEVDGNFTLWRDEDGVLTFHWQGKFRGAEFEPIRFELEKVTSDRLKDKRGKLMPTVLAKPILETRARQLAIQNLSDEDRLIKNIKQYSGQSLADRASELHLFMADGKPHKMRIQRLLKQLQDQKLIKRFRNDWELTKDGEKALEMILSGGSKPDGAL